MNAELLETLDRIGRGGTLDKVIYLLNRAAILARMGEVLEASAAQEAALARVEQIESAGAVLVGARGHYANSLLRLARYDEALALFTLSGEAAAESGNARWIANHDLMRGITLARLGRGAEARAFLDSAETIFLETAGSHERLLDEIALARARLALAEGDVDAAAGIVHALFLRADYPAKKDQPGLSSLLWTAAQVALVAGDAESAERYANDGYEAAARVARDATKSADVGQALFLRAKARHAQGKLAGAADDLERAVISLSRGFGESHPETREARSLLAEIPR